MWRLRLNARQCLCCAICADVCPPKAIDLRSSNRESSRASFGTYPFLAAPDRCDGCGECVRQCPNEALAVSKDVDDAERRSA